MATSLAQEDINFLRLAGLLIKIAPSAVRRRFDYELHPRELKNFLSKHRREIDNLAYKKRVITLSQYDLLYPRGSSGVSSDMFDVSLMACLLKHFTDLHIQDGLPVETNRTVAADISKIKFYRNYIVHSNNGKVTENKFSEIWSCVAEASLRLVPDLKSEIDAMRNSPLTNVSDLTDVIRLEKEMEKVNNHLRTVYKKLEPLQIENDNRKEIHNRTLTKWREIDKKYISTSATKFILQSLNKNRGVIITGPPGCGKSCAAHHVALTFEKAGYEIIPCHELSEILKQFTTSKFQVFIIDDICGKFALNQHKADYWEQNDEKLSMLIESCNQIDDNEDISSKSETKFIITCRENIYSHKAFPKLTCFSLVQCSFSTKYKISPDEMRNIALSYISEKTVNDIENICFYEFFPLLCALYCKKQKQDPRFFIHPVEIIEEEIKEMKIKSEISFLCLSLLVLNNNKCCKNDFESSGMEQLVKAICKNSGIESVVSIVSIQQSFEHLKSIYITEEGDFYMAIHDKMFDIISAAIAPYILTFLIEYVDIAFISNRIKLSSCSQSNLPFVVYVRPELESIYLKRLYKEILKRKYWEVLGSIQSENELFRKLFLLFLKEQDSCQEIKYVPDEDGFTPLFVSSYLGYLDFVEYFFLKSPGLIQLKDKEGRCSFYVACENGHIKVVKYLMTCHHDINAENSEKTTALSATCLNGHTEVAQLLLDNQADINKTNILNQSPLHFACLNDNIKLVQLLLYSEFNVDITIKDNFGKTALHVACQKGHTETVKTLIEFGMNETKKDNIGRTPLYLACKHGCNKTVKYILFFMHSTLKMSKRAIANELKNLHKTHLGSTVLHTACHNGHTQVVNLLDEIGMNINDTSNRGYTPLYLACRKGQYETVKFILDLNNKTFASRVDTMIKDENGWSVLHVACSKGHTQVVKLLIEIGMNINETANRGTTPLYLACRKGQYETVKFLLDLNGKILNSRVDTKTKDVNGWSVLHEACSNGHTQVVKLLIEVGMNINDTSNKGSTPLYLALRNGHYDTVKFLRDRNNEMSEMHVDTTIKNTYEYKNKNKYAVTLLNDTRKNQVEKRNTRKRSCVIL